MCTRRYGRSSRRPVGTPREKGSTLVTQDVHDLQQAMERIWEIAGRFGLDPFPTHFELVPAGIMHEFGAYGLPGRFSHWTHGRAYQQLKTMYGPWQVSGFQQIPPANVNA